MFAKRRWSPFTLGVLAMTGVLAGTASAREPARAPVSARETQRACTQQYQDAERLVTAAHLREAQGLLRLCAKATCGSFLQQACGTRFAQITVDIPSVVPMVADAGGMPVVDVLVTMDGAPLTNQTTGAALPVDPGLHEFTFGDREGTFSTQKIVVAQGQRNRVISAIVPEGHDRRAIPVEREVPRPVSFVLPPARGDANPPQPGTRLAPYLLGVTSVVGAGGYALLTYWGNKDNERLAQCAPGCAQDSVDHIHRLYVAADVSLGVALVALAGAVWTGLSNDTAKPRLGQEIAWGLKVRPTGAGGSAAITGSF